jgi:hypothetical protein
MSGGVGFATGIENTSQIGHGSRPRAKDYGAAWRRRRRQPGMLDKTRRMAGQNVAVAKPSRDASPDNSVVPLHCKPAEHVHVGISRLFVCLPPLIVLT